MGLFLNVYVGGERLLSGELCKPPVSAATKSLL
jgi:hypothetical protein